MRWSGALSSPRRPLRVAVVLASLLVVGATIPAYADTPPNDPIDPGQAAAFRKLYAVASAAATNKVLPRSAVVAVDKLANGNPIRGQVADAATSAVNRQQFWKIVSTDVGVPASQIIANMRAGSSIHQVAGPGKWLVLRDDVRAWATRELDMELFLKNPISHKPVISKKVYLPIRNRIYVATDTVLNVHMPKTSKGPHPTPSPSPSRTPQPHPSRTPKPTPSPTVKPKP